MTTPRQYVNRLSSYIDASNVYGISDAEARLAARRQGRRQADGQRADLLLTHGYLPRVGARGDAKKAPAEELFGALVGTPQEAIVAGDTARTGTSG